MHAKVIEVSNQYNNGFGYYTILITDKKGNMTNYISKIAPLWNVYVTNHIEEAESIVERLNIEYDAASESLSIEGGVMVADTPNENRRLYTSPVFVIGMIKDHEYVFGAPKTFQQRFGIEYLMTISDYIKTEATKEQIKDYSDWLQVYFTVDDIISIDMAYPWFCAEMSGDSPVVFKDYRYDSHDKGDNVKILKCTNGSCYIEFEYSLFDGSGLLVLSCINHHSIDEEITRQKLAELSKHTKLYFV